MTSPSAATGSCTAVVAVTVFSAARAGEAGRRRATVDGARIVAADSEPQNWLSHGRTYGEQRYQPARRINDTCRRARPRVVVRHGTTRGLQASPIVVDGTMYTTGTWSVVYALDAKTGRELWKYDPEVPRAWDVTCAAMPSTVASPCGRAPCTRHDRRPLVSSTRRRGEALGGEHHRPHQALQHHRRAPRGEGQGADRQRGAELGVRGYLSAYDADTGKLVWRFYTVPGNRRTASSTPSWRKREDLERRVVVGGGGGTVWTRWPTIPRSTPCTWVPATVRPGRVTSARRAAATISIYRRSSRSTRIPGA